MSSRIIRGAERFKKPRISSPIGGSSNGLPQDHVMEVEKQAFEKGYHEGNRMGKQMGEQMIATVVKRYDETIVELAVSHTKLVESMETETVRLAMEVTKSILGREVSADPDVVTALVTVALKRTQGHQGVVLKVSPDDFERVRGAIEQVNSAVRVEQVATLERGDFVLDTSKTHLDGQMISRINHIGRALLEEA